MKVIETSAVSETDGECLVILDSLRHSLITERLKSSKTKRDT